MRPEEDEEIECFYRGYKEKLSGLEAGGLRGSNFVKVGGYAAFSESASSSSLSAMGRGISPVPLQALQGTPLLSVPLPRQIGQMRDVTGTVMPMRNAFVLPPNYSDDTRLSRVDAKQKLVRIT